jgi:hypothetical protein
LAVGGSLLMMAALMAVEPLAALDVPPPPPPDDGARSLLGRRSPVLWTAYELGIVLVGNAAWYWHDPHSSDFDLRSDWSSWRGKLLATTSRSPTAASLTGPTWPDASCRRRSGS